MNQDILHGWWLQLRGRAKKGWAWLVGDETMRAEGNAEVVAGALQESYGMVKKNAVREVTRRIDTLAAVAKRTARVLDR